MPATEPRPGGIAPIVVLAVGNESRGDDGLGPALAALLEAEGRSDVEVIADFQLQVEHALDLAGRRLAIFLDAGHGTPAPFELRPVTASPEFLHTTHALAPEAVLETAQRLGVTAPPAWVLCIRGESFELGEGLSTAAQGRLAAAFAALRALLDRVDATSA